MNYQVVILSADPVFARMLEIELEPTAGSVLVARELNAGDRVQVVVLDLDSAEAPPKECYAHMIGFSRRSARSSEQARRCAMILRRPFAVRLLRQEVSGLLEGAAYAPDARVPAELPGREVLLDGRTLLCDGSRIALTEKEAAILGLLLDSRGSAVGRDRLSEALGGGGNETDVYICLLRRKTDPLPGGRLIETVRGRGYRIR